MTTDKVADEGMVDGLWGALTAYQSGDGTWLQIGHAAFVAELARSTPLAELQAEIAALKWFDTQHCLELSYYSPIYGDDDDQSEEWRVHRQRGSINDREWTLVGRGATALEAIKGARAALSKEPLK